MTFEQWEYEEMIKNKEKEVLNRVREAIDKQIKFVRKSNYILLEEIFINLKKELGIEEK